MLLSQYNSGFTNSADNSLPTRLPPQKPGKIPLPSGSPNLASSHLYQTIFRRSEGNFRMQKRAFSLPSGKFDRDPVVFEACP
jgi:hypothetical protein